MSLNRVTIIGNLGADPEIKNAADSTICTFSIATNEFYKSAGERKEHTEWHQIVVFGKLAQTCAIYLKKGSRVFLEGRLRTSSYKDKEGKNQTRTKIYSHGIKFLDGAKISDSNNLLGIDAEDESTSMVDNLDLELA